MTVTKHISELGKATRFGENWPGERCGARTHEGLQRISQANLKHGRYTKDKLERQPRAAEAGLECRAKLKIIEQRLIEAGLID